MDGARFDTLPAAEAADAGRVPLLRCPVVHASGRQRPGDARESRGQGGERWCFTNDLA